MDREEVITQLDKVLILLNSRLKEDPDRLVLKSLYYRYLKAKEILMSNEDIDKIMIKGGCRAYLDSYSDYRNTLLFEMDRAEKMILELKVGE